MSSVDRTNRETSSGPSDFALYKILRDISRRNKGVRSSEKLPIPEVDDYLGLFRIALGAREFYARHMTDSFFAEPSYAVRDEDEANPGRHKIVFKTLDGVETTYDLPKATHDPPSVNAKDATEVLAATAADTTAPKVDHCSLVQDRKAALPDRAEALRRWVDAERDEATAYVLEQLGRSDNTPGWRDELIFFAEDLHFAPDLRSDAADRLLTNALTLRSQPGAEDKVVWSALRRGASLLEPHLGERLIPFLEPGVIDTRAVALRTVSRLYESQPPATTPEALADRVHQFASKFLDPDVFTPGDTSVIARVAVAALAALADPRLQPAITRVQVLNKGFLNRALIQELQQIRDGWSSRGVPPDHPAMKNIKAGLALWTTAVE